MVETLGTEPTFCEPSYEASNVTLGDSGDLIAGMTKEMPDFNFNFN